MITGDKELRKMYPNLNEKQYQPAGIDLTLNDVMELKTNNHIYGLCKDVKQLPQPNSIPTNNIMIGGTMRTGFTLEPNVPYLGVTKEQIKIDSKAGQFYFPRSSLLRSGVDVRTAFGDPGFNGHLSFLLINHTDTPYFLEQGVRFAQLVNIKATMVGEEYNGDYQE